MQNRIEKAIDIFLDALNNGTLLKGTCVACAVGNLIAHGMGGKIKTIIYEGESIAFATCLYENEEVCCNSSWGNLFSTGMGITRYRQEFENDPDIIRNIKSTDFSLDELMTIEREFEMNTSLYFDVYHLHTEEEIRKDQIRGLEAVVRAMLLFDNDDRDVYSIFTSKAMFQSPRLRSYSLT